MYELPSQGFLGGDVAPLVSCNSRRYIQEDHCPTYVFSSLDSLPGGLEPTPIDTQSAVVVDHFHLFRKTWGDEDFMMDLRSFLDVSSSNSALVTDNAVSPLSKLSPAFYSDSSFASCYPQQSLLSDSSGKREAPGTTCYYSNKKARRSSEVSLTDSASGGGGEAALRNSHVEQWNQRFAELQEYQKEHGHCLVPLNWKRNPSLAHWVKRQRYQYRIKTEGKHSTMTPSREEALEQLGFTWDSHSAAWLERWQELADFKAQYGHTNVPKKYPENKQLAVWVKCQRRQYKLYMEQEPSNMTAERIDRLNSLGFVFNPRQTSRRL